MADLAVSPLEALPDTILHHSILPSLDMISLGLLACCSKRLLHAASSDHLWFPLCRGLGCLLSQQGSEFVGQSPPGPWLSWRQLFCCKQNRRCVECQRYTPYVFTLSWPQFRLCERCEQECPKYALITEREAKAHYLLTDDELWGLPFKKVCHKRFCVYFFSKVDIERISSRMDAQSENGNEIQIKRNSGKTVETKADFVDTKGQEGCQANDRSKECTNIISLEIVEDRLPSRFSNIDLFEEHSGDQRIITDTVESSSRANQEESMQETESMVQRDHRRETRKEHKRQVKAAKREKRNLRSTGVLSFSGYPNSVKKNLCKENLDDEGVLGEVSRHALQSISPGSTSLSTNELTDAQNVGKFHKWRSKREHVSASSGGFRQSETIGCNLQWRSKSPSDWVRERDWLEVELGPYGFSALELAP